MHVHQSEAWSDLNLDQHLYPLETSGSEMLESANIIGWLIYLTSSTRSVVARHSLINQSTIVLGFIYQIRKIVRGL
jgi:hypothetical protein